MGSKNQVGIVAAGVPAALKAVEDLAARFTPLRIQGTHRVCMDPEVQELIKYTIIESGMGGIGTTPQQQLAWKLMIAAFQQHAINSALEAMTPEQKQAIAKAMNPVQPDRGVSEVKPDPKYADL